LALTLDVTCLPHDTASFPRRRESRVLILLGFEFGELLDEIEAIVYSGTKLNIDYFLEEIMDEDHMQDIYDYFKESVTDKIDDAMDELGDDYTEDEIRLVRIKFISEMAN
jgi:ATP-dependent DNA helicase RecQ